ncbi:hypothetical protein E0K89_019500 [Aquicoccus sp. SCR17]|nr:hypothetical protein [Carideicomes alvinocaridis]
MAVKTTSSILRIFGVMIPPALRSSGACTLALEKDRPADLVEVGGQIAKILANRRPAQFSYVLASTCHGIATSSSGSVVPLALRSGTVCPTFIPSKVTPRNVLIGIPP